MEKQPLEHHDSVTALLGAWGELLMHDLASTGNFEKKLCCRDDHQQPHAECYAKVGHGQCKDFMRSLPAVDLDDCTFGKHHYYGYSEHNLA